MVPCKLKNCNVKYAQNEKDQHWLAVHSEKHVALICECGYTSISVCSFELHLRHTHNLKLHYNECVSGFFYRQLPGFKSLFRCDKKTVIQSQARNCYFQSLYEEVLKDHSCEEQRRGFAIEIMEEPLFYDSIRNKRKPERGFPLIRNKFFVPPAGQKFVNKEPYNAEDELNFEAAKEVIFKQNKARSQTPKRRPPTPTRSTSADKKYSAVAKTKPLSSMKVPQTSASLKTTMQVLPGKPKKGLTLLEMELHRADLRRKLDNLCLPKEKQRNLSPPVDPKTLKSDQLVTYAKTLEAKHKAGIIKLGDVLRPATKDTPAVLDKPDKACSWIYNCKDKRLTPAEHELLHQDTDRKIDLMYSSSNLVSNRHLSPIPVLSQLSDEQLEKLKTLLRSREKEGVIKSRPVTERQPPARSSTRSETKKVETLTKQQEDELLASPPRAQSKSPRRSKTEDQGHSDMEVDVREGERGRSRKKKKSHKKRPRPDSTPIFQPIGRVGADETHRSKKQKQGSRPQSQARPAQSRPVRGSGPTPTPTPPGFAQPGFQPFTLRRDLLQRIELPSMGQHRTSPLVDFRIIEQTPRFCCYTGALTCSNSSGCDQQMQIHIQGEIAVGQFAVCNAEGVPMSLAAVTYSEGSPFSHTSESWRQFNPFAYPIYAWLMNLNTRPYQVWYTFTMQKLIPAGVYRLIKLPHTSGDLGVEIKLTSKNLDFGNPSFLRMN